MLGQKMEDESQPFEDEESVIDFDTKSSWNSEASLNRWILGLASSNSNIMVSGKIGYNQYHRPKSKFQL